MVTAICLATYVSKLVSQGTEQEPTVAYLSSAFDGIIMQALPLFIPAAIMG